MDYAQALFMKHALANKTMTRPVINGGIPSTSTGVQMKRLTTGSIGGASRTDVVVTWPTAFADTNYTFQVFIIDTSAAGIGMRVERVRAQTASTITVQVVNDAAGALTGTLHCIAIHD
jgi:hypothetical protein